MSESGKLDDWVLPLNMPFDPKKISLEKFEKHVKRGLQVVRETDDTARVVGKVVIKGNKNEDVDPR